ncbi:MAG: hypothetical protein ABIQ44_10840 [Chloroflexia bacterium]
MQDSERIQRQNRLLLIIGIILLLFKKAGTQTLRVTLTARGKPSWSAETVEGQI